MLPRILGRRAVVLAGGILAACSTSGAVVDEAAVVESPIDVTRPRTEGLWLWGVEDGWVISGFRMYRDYAVAQTIHAGIDIRMFTGQAIFALAPGTVYRVRDYGSVGGYFQEITVYYPAIEKYVLYGHIQRGVSNLHAPGDAIAPGDILAYGGTSDDALGDYPHVHVQVWPDQAAADAYDNDAATDPELVRATLFAQLPADAGPFAMCEAGDGTYCGTGADAKALFRCTAGAASKIEDCGAAGCTTRPIGLDDSCTPPECPSGDGLFCGDEGGVEGKDFTLYRCENGKKSVAEVCIRCANGRCLDRDCPVGDGLYCGGNMIGGDSRTLYRCAEGIVSVTSACANGCQIMPTGTDDRCR